MINELCKIYPCPEQLKQHLLSFDNSEIEGFIRLWLSEGIPFAFKETPLIYEKVRTFVANELEINPKSITLIGSARIGISLAPKNFGKAFSDGSDHDFSLISDTVFKKCKKAFELWMKDYKESKISPKNDNEKRFWSANASQVPQNINRGFIDPYKIPNQDQYQPAGMIADLSFRIGKNFKINKPGFRVYRDWSAFIEQSKINLNNLILKLKK